VTVEISPEPTEAERAAILVALGSLPAAGRDEQPGGAWWSAGLPGADDES
jgi:hypothetical protein